MKRSFSFSLIVLAAVAALLCFPFRASAVTADDVDKALDDLDSWLKSRHKFIRMRQDAIDSLCVILNSKPVDDPALLMKIAEGYTAFNNDSALVYLRRGAVTTPYPQNLAFRWKCASLMPLSGFFDAAEAVYNQINPDSIPKGLLVDYYDAGRQMHSYIAAFFRNFPDVAQPHDSLALVMQEKMLELSPPNSPLYKYNLAEYNFLKGRTSTAKVLLEEVIDSEPPSSNFRARAANHLSTLARAENDTNAFFYYIALSATADVLAATREVVSLQELGASVYAAGDITRAHQYLSSALENAVECGAPLRMIDSSRSLPIIERAHSEHLAQNRRTIYYIISGMAVLLLVLVIVLLVLRHEMHLMTLLQKLAPCRKYGQGGVHKPLLAALLDIYGQAQSVLQDCQPKACRRAGRRALPYDTLWKVCRRAEPRILRRVRQCLPSYISRLRRACQCPSAQRRADRAAARRTSKHRFANSGIHAFGY